jgi:hypothetical protein
MAATAQVNSSEAMTEMRTLLDLCLAKRRVVPTPRANDSVDHSTQDASQIDT